MLAGYARHFSIERALLLAYRAKRRAEVSPGVGATTKMFVVTNKFSELIDDIHIKVQKIHQAIEADIAKVEKDAEEGTSQFIVDFLRGKMIADGRMPAPAASSELALERLSGSANNQANEAPKDDLCPKAPEESAGQPTL